MKILIFVLVVSALLVSQLVYADFDIGNLTNQIGILQQFNPDKLSVDRTSSSLSITDDLNQVTTFTFDSNGNVVEAKVPGHGVFKFSYNMAGKVTEVANQLGQKINYYYDSNNNAVEIRDFIGRRTSIERDDNGRIISITNPDTTVIRWEYDDRGRVVSKLTPDGQVWTISYNSVGEVESVSPKLGGPFPLNHDSEGRVIVYGPESRIIPGSFKIPVPEVFDETLDLRTSIINDITSSYMQRAVLGFPRYFNSVNYRVPDSPFYAAGGHPWEAEYVRSSNTQAVSLDSSTISSQSSDDTRSTIKRDPTGRPFRGDILPPVIDRRGFPSDSSNTIGFNNRAELQFRQYDELGRVVGYRTVEEGEVNFIRLRNKIAVVDLSGRVLAVYDENQETTSTEGNRLISIGISSDGSHIAVKDDSREIARFSLDPFGDVFADTPADQYVEELEKRRFERELGAIKSSFDPSQLGILLGLVMGFDLVTLTTDEVGAVSEPTVTSPSQTSGIVSVEGGVCDPVSRFYGCGNDANGEYPKLIVLFECRSDENCITQIGYDQGAKKCDDNKDTCLDKCDKEQKTCSDQCAPIECFDNCNTVSSNCRSVCLKDGADCLKLNKDKIDQEYKKCWTWFKYDQPPDSDYCPSKCVEDKDVGAKCI